MQFLEKKLENWDRKTILYARRIVVPFSRFTLFLVYFWFGALKVFGESPANPLVSELLAKTLPGVSFASFIIAFGIFEMIIGLIFIIPHLERLGIFLLIIHLITTAMPLFVLSGATWQNFMTPTLEGQYIIKNVLIIALAILILANLRLPEEKVI